MLLLRIITDFDQSLFTVFFEKMLGNNMYYFDQVTFATDFMTKKVV